jgi:putative transposase
LELAHKILLETTEAEEAYFRKACGIARFSWNWALATWNEEYKAGRKPTAFKLKKQFNQIKAAEFPWVYEVTKYACQQPFLFLGKAFSNFFRDVKKPQNQRRHRYPKFKKKGKSIDSFYIGGDQIQVEGNRVKIPNLGWVKMKENLRWGGNILSATVSRQADKWFVSLCVDVNFSAIPCKNQASIGVDLGVLSLATLSDGKVEEGPKPLKHFLHRLKRIQRKRSKKVLGSSNFKKIKKKEGKLHYKICCIRKDTLHKLTTKLTEQYQYISVEDLNVKGMLSNHKLARSISDMGFYEFKRQLLYKAKMKGNTVFIADQWFASSKTCSSCDTKKETLALSAREFRCDSCGLKINRDLNAARNLEKQLYTESSSGIYACGQDGSYNLLKGDRKPAWLNQEKEPVQICVGF